MTTKTSEGAAAFRENVVATLSFWRERTRDLDDLAIVELDRERQNLFRVVQFGLSLPQAWETTTAIALQVIPLVNRRMYRQEWLPVLEQLFNQAPEGQTLAKIQLLCQIGRLQRLDRQLDLAIETHLIAQKLADELDDAHMTALVAYNLGRDYLDKRNYTMAEQYSQLTLELLEETEDQKLEAYAYITLGHIFRNRGDYKQSIDYHSLALAIVREIGSTTQMARSLFELANALRAKGSPSEAVVYYEEALEILSPTANELDKTLTNINLGGSYFELEEWLLAEKALRNADSDYLRQSGNIHYQAYVTVSLGNVLLKQDKLAQAEGTLRRSVKLWRQVDDPLNLANALGSLGEVLAARGKREAEECLKEALHLLEDYHDEPRAKKLRFLFQSEVDKVSHTRN